MPISYQRGDGGGDRSTLPTAERPQTGNRAESTGRMRLKLVRWSRWVTAHDERTCPECAPLDGAIWPIDEGPQPPLHAHCRCERIEHMFTVSSR